jgi:hypothetical protein
VSATRNLGLAVGALACAAALGGLTVAARAGNRPHLTPAVTCPSAPAEAAAPVDARALAALVRAAVHDELAAQRGTAAGPPAAARLEDAAPASVPQPPTPAQAEAAREAHRVVALGRAAGTWDQERALVLRGLLGGLTAEDRHAVTMELIAAINAQELRLEGPPM